MYKRQGTLDELRAIKKQLRESNIKWIQDIVPNHMAFHPANEWLMDLLEFGQSSTFSRFFDTCYSSNLFEQGKLMVPILAKTLDEAISDNEITVVFSDDSLRLSYQGNVYPISPESYGFILGDYLRNTQADFSGLLVQINTAQANGDNEEWKQLRIHIFKGLSGEILTSTLQRLSLIHI